MSYLVLRKQESSSYAGYFVNEFNTQEELKEFLLSIGNRSSEPRVFEAEEVRVDFSLSLRKPGEVC